MLVMKDSERRLIIGLRVGGDLLDMFGPDAVKVGVVGKQHGPWLA